MTEPSIRDFYASVDWSETDFSRKNDRLAQSVIRLLGDLPGSQVLDLGCGSASLAVELAERGYNVSGLDIHISPARRRVQTRGVDVTLIEQDMRDMDFREEFDAVVNWDVSGIGLLSTDKENIDIVSRIRDALVPGGKLLIETYNVDYIRENPGAVEGLTLDPTSKRCCHPERPIPSIRLFSLGEWKMILGETGFEFVGVWGSLAGDEFTAESRMLVLLGRRPVVKG